MVRLVKLVGLVRLVRHLLLLIGDGCISLRSQGCTIARSQNMMGKRDS